LLEVISDLSGARGMPLVLGYHRVVERFRDAAERAIPSMLIGRDMLRQQLEWVGRRFRFVSLDEIGSAERSEDPGRRPLAAVTFDDGYEDVFHVAFPLLVEMGIPAAVFPVTDWIGTRELQFHDRLYLLLTRAFAAWRAPAAELGSLLVEAGADAASARRLRRARSPFSATAVLLDSFPQAVVAALADALAERFPIAEAARAEHGSMSWEMLVTMQRAGFTIGSHTRSHALLTNENPSKVWEETRGSKARLEYRLGTAVRHFAYPDGRFDAGALQAAAGAGYRFAYTTCRHRSARHAHLTIPRRLFWERSSVDAWGSFAPDVMECQVQSVFDLFAPCRQEHALLETAPAMDSDVAYGVSPHGWLEHT
jgi:peptidoglycan/xylan/chitin deacetylase (PgdA/CDA1 family)